MCVLYQENVARKEEEGKKKKHRLVKDAKFKWARTVGFRCVSMINVICSNNVS